MTEIVKVQRPIMPPDGPWLIYDKKRKHVEQRDPRAISKHARDLMGDDIKGYFIGAWSSVIGWGLSKRATRPRQRQRTACGLSRHHRRTACSRMDEKIPKAAS